jgi:N-dimethylarginine dimethylaminohydrolase
MVLEVKEPAFHGNMAVLPLPAADRLLVCSDVLVGDGVARLLRRFGGGRVEHVEEEEIRAYATNGLPVGDAWLVPSVVPDRIKSMVAGWGVRVVELPMRELCEKAGGASRCLVCRAPGGASRVSLPREHRLDAIAGVIDREPDDG